METTTRFLIPAVHVEDRSWILMVHSRAIVKVRANESAENLIECCKEACSFEDSVDVSAAFSRSLLKIHSLSMHSLLHDQYCQPRLRNRKSPLLHHEKCWLERSSLLSKAQVKAFSMKPTTLSSFNSWSSCAARLDISQHGLNDLHVMNHYYLFCAPERMYAGNSAQYAKNISS
ncbi:hypothetical protein MRB53_041595 [Persea americana]|nr:hypothetical protein MRB53_041595 [Persea americana]